MTQAWFQARRTTFCLRIWRAIPVREQHQDVDALIFRFQEKEFKGVSWIDVVRSLEMHDKEYRSCGGPIRQYLIWSLNQLSGTVAPRDMDLSDRLEDETLALGYLLLLEEYGRG